jgi:triacylglycerol lipase
MAQQTIVLTHGILGFGNLIWQLMPFNYFNGVAAHLSKNGHSVKAPQVNPIGSVEQRAGKLEQFILDQVPAPQEFHVIAHSMGGLDARAVLKRNADIANRVKTLVAIGTPHRDSPVADAIVQGSGPLFDHLPMFLVNALRSDAGALNDLTTEVASKTDDETPDLTDVRYIDVMGDASQAGLLSFLSLPAAFLRTDSREVNDGVVMRNSALHDGHEHLDDWPVDHLGEIGWTFPPISAEPPLTLLSLPPHFAWYDAIVEML